MSTSPAAPAHPPPSALRGATQHFLAWTFCAVYIPVLILVVVLSLGTLAPTVGLQMTRFWGYAMLWCAGIRLDASGLSPEWRTRRARVATFNHSSTLDLFIGAAILPDGGVPVVKRELIYIPFIGWAAYFLRFVMLDRGRREKALKSLEAAAQRIRTESLTTMIAPEGTRSRTGELLPFKTGALHLAELSGAPVVPVIIEDAGRQWPRSHWASTPGVVRVRDLAPIGLEEMPGATVREKAEWLRGVYVGELG